jgi:hypothetical protein
VVGQQPQQGEAGKQGKKAFLDGFHGAGFKKKTRSL